MNRKIKNTKRNMICEIYVATHKECDRFTNDEIYKICQVGSINHEKLKCADITDSTCIDNISKKNYLYAELSAQYHLWKNSDADIKGLVHYRRYFTKYPTSEDNNILSKKQIIKTLNKYDCILAYPITDDLNNITKFISRKSVDIDTINKLKSVIQDKYPSYIQSFDRVMKRNYGSWCNMIIAKKEVYDNYCEWLFNILRDMEDYCDKVIKDKRLILNEQRINGYLSELLLNVYFLENQNKIKFYPITMFGIKKDDNYKYKKIISKNCIYDFIHKYVVNKEYIFKDRL